MPKGVYPRTQNQLKAAKINLAKGREPKARERAAETIKELAKTKEWKNSVSEGTKKAIHRPEVRKRHLEGIAKRFGRLTKTSNFVIPILATRLKIADEYIERFWKRVDVKGEDECWKYLGYKNRQGYGEYWNGSRVAAHRFVMMLVLGHELQENEQALHLCDNPPCCNPAHLYIGTNADNMKDKMKRGRHRAAQGSQHPMAKLTEKEVLEIRRLYKTGNCTYPELGNLFGVGRCVIGSIVRRKTWKHI